MMRFSSGRTLQFTHKWTVDSSKIGNSKYITFVHRHAIYRWYAIISRDNYNYDTGMRGTGNVKLSFEAEGGADDYDVRHHVALDCVAFTLLVKNPSTNEVVMEAEQLVLPSPRERGGMKFEVPLDSDFGQKLNSLYGRNGRNNGYITEISTTIKMPSSAFQTGFRPTTTDLIHTDHQNGRNDFTIRSRTGELIRTKKMLLLFESPYFRSFLKRSALNVTSYTEPRYSGDVIKTVVSYLTTGVFPEETAEWTPTFAAEVYKLGYKYLGDSQDEKFEYHLENITCKRMNKRNLPVVVEWLLFGYEHDLFLVQNISIALILTKFDKLFRTNYEGPNVSPSRRGVVDRLNRIQSGGRSILYELEEIRKENENVTMNRAPARG